MNSNTALAIPISNEVPSQGLVGFLSLDPDEMIRRVTRIATSLAKIIKDKELSTMISGSEHTHVEGWTTMGSLLGVLPREREVKELPDGSYEAWVELYCVHSGKIVGLGSALCGMDEVPWGTAKKYARRSMAATRATGKAFKNTFGWIMVLAGYKATPFEEMPTDGTNLFKNSGENNNEKFQSEWVVLDCPKEEKDELKAMAGKGAKWDPNIYKWSSNHIEAIKRWGPKQRVPAPMELNIDLQTPMDTSNIF